MVAPYGRREWQRALCSFEGSVKFKGLQILQLPSTFVFQPLVNGTHCVRGRWQMSPFTAAIWRKIVGSLFLYLIFTKSLSLMHGLSLPSPSHFCRFYCKLCMCFNLFETCVWCQKRPGALGYYHSVLYPKL